jgi:hypothetical protein
MPDVDGGPRPVSDERSLRVSVITRDPVRFDRDADLRRLASCRRDRVRFVHVPEHRYLAIDGTEPPGSAGYIAAIGGLYGVAYPLHFALRARGIRGHRVGMLEGLYWLPERGSDDPVRWRLLVAVPAEANEDDVDHAMRNAGSAAERMYLDRWEEGPSAEILHVGPYADEARSLARLAAAIVDAGLVAHGPHHEIYLNNPREVGDDRTRTVLRQAVTA